MDIREKLVELLKEISYDKELGLFDLCDMCEGAEIIADLLIAHGVTVQEWISVKDRLPELEQVVLVALNSPHKRLNYPYKENTLLLFRRGYNYTTGYEEKWERPFGAETIDYNDKVTHWMPLPSAPKGD